MRIGVSVLRAGVLSGAGPAGQTTIPCLSKPPTHLTAPLPSHLKGKQKDPPKVSEAGRICSRKPTLANQYKHHTGISESLHLKPPDRKALGFKYFERFADARHELP